MTITTNRQGSVAVLAIDNPPVNALSIGAGVIAGLHQALNEALADPACDAVVIQGAGKFFSGGADINDFESNPEKIVQLRDLLDAIEAAPKPIVAAIRGVALGGGLELALACHYRIAEVSAKLGLPEVTLGLVPGGGGTQRLPRLVGGARALPMMLTGKPVTAAEAAAMGLVDEVTAGDAAEAALAFLAAQPRQPRSTGALPPPTDITAAVQAARAQKARTRSEAPAFIVDCVEAVGKGSFKEGLAVEADLFTRLLTSEASLGLRHVFFGERIVARVPGLPRDVKPLPINSVAVVGGGVMGTGIAIAMLNAGLTVVLIEPRDEGRAKAESTIRSTIGRDAEKGRISQQEAEARIGRLTLADALEAAADSDLAIEAVFEDLKVKEDVFSALDKIMRPDAILASNTSTLDLNAIAAFTSRPERVIGLHFFSPANIMRLLEVVRGDKTDPQLLATALHFAGRIRKVGVVSGVCDGFIGNRMLEEYLRQAYQLAEEGATPSQIDAAMEAWGFVMGPMRVMDLAGQDIGWAIRKRRAVEHPDRPYSGWPDRLCEQGRFGQKTGKGIYLYPDGRTAVPDPEIEQMIRDYAAEKGIPQRTISDEEIVERCLFAMVNEGAKILEEGIAYRPVDIDIVYVMGYGFAPERGGPMFAADRIGLDKVLRRIEDFAQQREGWAWKPAQLLTDLVAKGATFGSLNG